MSDTLENNMELPEDETIVEAELDDEVAAEEMKVQEAVAVKITDLPQVDDEPVTYCDVVGVTFRSAPKAYYFDPAGSDPHPGDAVIVETARGLEYGKIKFGRRKIAEKDLISPLKPILRIATTEDTERHEANRSQEKYALQVCREKIAARELPMNLVDAAYTFDNRKLFFYFTSETRVDFRELVKDLAAVFRTRIDLRQIGIRDEAKMLGGIGSCGRPYCCAEFLSDFVQVSIKMAKEQNFSLNSTKISGSCGRLMCCLRYESDVYEEALRLLPSVGAYVSTPAGNGYVTEVKPLFYAVRVKLEDKDNTLRMCKVEEITVLKNGKSQKTEEKKPKAEGKNEPKKEENSKNSKKTTENK